MTTDKTTRKDFDKFGTRIINMTVKAKDGAMVYDSEGNPIPGDSFVTVPVSASLVRAVQAGDLEEAEAETPTPPPEPEPEESLTSRSRRTSTKTTE